ncbi:hypothetical protein F5Y10DRAFT_288470 [Nemania abortiva]|nr:hypothetical protein F5Y10DRAFT_288470 [Nemania abortiva]
MAGTRSQATKEQEDTGADGAGPSTEPNGAPAANGTTSTGRTPLPTVAKKQNPKKQPNSKGDAGSSNSPSEKKGRKSTSKRRPIPGEDAPFNFYQSRKLDDIPQIDMTTAGPKFMNARTETTPETTPQWWVNDWPYQVPGSEHATKEDRAFHLPNLEAQRLPGQSFLYTLSTSNRSQDESAAAACFPSSIAYCTFCDTEGRDFFGPFMFAKLEYNYGGVAFLSWDAVPQTLVKAHQEPALHDLLQRVTECPTLRSYLVRQGDIVVDFPEDQKHQMHIVATILATALAFLALATVGPESEERRFTRATDEQLKQSPDAYFYGFHADQWVSALALIAQSSSRLKKGNAQSARGPSTPAHEKEHGLQLGRITSADLKFRAAGVAQQADPIEEAALKITQYHTLLNAPLPPEEYAPGPESDDDMDIDDRDNMAAKHDAYKRRKARDAHKRLKRRLDNRFAFCMGSGAKFEQWAIGNITTRSRQAKSKGAAKKNDPVPPLTDAAIKEILDKLQENFMEVKQHKLDDTSADAFSTITNGGDLKSFTAQQSSLLDSWASLCAEQKGLDPEEARKEMDKLNKQSFIMTSALDADPPRHVDFAGACEAVGLSDWKNLELNPISAPGAKLKPHQVADACILRQLEEGITKGGILANNVGTGKTVIIFLTIYRHLLELKKQKASGEEVDALPTLIVVPASIITQVYQDFVKFFHGLYYTNSPCVL